MTYKSSIAIPPGETLEETLEYLRMSRSSFYVKTEIRLTTLDGIIEGTEPITPIIAIKLQKALGVSAGFWLRLENNYQETKIRLEKEKKKAVVK